MASKKVVLKIIVSEGGHPHLFKLEYKEDLGELDGRIVSKIWHGASSEHCRLDSFGDI